MSRSKTKQILVDGKGVYQNVMTSNHNKVFDLIDVIKDNFHDVKFYNDYIFTHKVNGTRVTSLLRRVVGSGSDNMEKELYRKRVQIDGKLIDRPIDDVICVYKHLDATVFIRYARDLSTREFPKNLTTLFWIKIQEIAEAINRDELVVIKKKSRITSNGSNEYDIWLSKKSSELYDSSFNDKYVDSQDIKTDEEIFLGDFDEASEEGDKGNYEEDRLEVGFAGEKIVNELLKNSNFELSKLDDFIWQNENGESGKPFDFKGDEYFIEVKSSKYSKNEFLLSSNEMKILLANTDKYFLVQVKGVSLEDGSFQSYEIITGPELLKNNFDEIVNITYVYKGENHE